MLAPKNILANVFNDYCSWSPKMNNFPALLHDYNPGQNLWPKLRKTALYLTPQAMYNQFKRPSAGSVSELYYICRKT